MKTLSNMPFRIWVKLFMLRRILYERQLKRLLDQLSPQRAEASGVIQIVSLCSSRSLIEGVASVSSLTRFLANGEWGLTVHDDGSLSANDSDWLKQRIPGVKLIPRSRADTECLSYLKAQGFATLANFRTIHPVNIKAVDFPYYHHGKRILQLDTDVLFFQKPHELLASFYGSEQKSIFNVDRGPALAYGLDDMNKLAGKKVDPLFNGGLVSFLASREFHAFAEAVLIANLRRHKDWTLEQTLTAMFLAKTTKMERLPPTYDVSFALLALNGFRRSELVSQHYCAWARMLFASDYIRFINPAVRPAAWHIQRYYRRHLTVPLPDPRIW